MGYFELHKLGVEGKEAMELSKFKEAYDKFEDLLINIALNSSRISAYSYSDIINYEYIIDYEYTSLREIEDDYLQLIIKFHNLDISKDNPIYKKIEKFNRKEENQLKIYYMNDILSFGEHSGKRIAEVISYEAKPTLLLSYIEKYDFFAIDNMYFLFPDIKKNEEEFLKALEINLLKQLFINIQREESDFSWEIIPPSDEDVTFSPNENSYSGKVLLLWNCQICYGDNETGCLYFDPTECPR